MPNWKKVIVSGSDAALNSLNVTAHFTASGLNYPSSDGTSGQVVITDGTGNLSFSNVENTTITIKNVSGATIAKGTPCYITGSGTSGNVAGVWPADASNPALMPAGVIAGETLIAGAEGIGLINGFIANVNTSAFSAGNTIYVAVGGGYTNVKPTGSSVLIQKLGNVEKSHASNGSGVINGPNYYNEVPNIQQGYTWVGNSNGVAIPVATSSIQNVVSSSFASTASFINVTGSNAFVQNGNSFGATALLGTNDNQSLAFETSGSTRVFVSSSGLVGVRTTNPEYTFDVSGSIRANGSFVFATDGAGGNGLSFVRNSSNNWTWGTAGIGNIMTIAGNSITLPQVVTTNNGLNVTPGGNQQSYALGVTVGAYPAATIASFTSGSVTALTISGSGMRGTGSFQYSGSITTNNVIATQNVTASRAYLSSSNGTSNGPTLTVYGSGSSQPIFTVQGSQGELFSITDSLSGSLYSVNDISGLPILEVFSDNTVLIGNYQDPMLITTTKLVTTASGAFTIYSLPTSSYDTAFFEYSIRSGSNARAGSIMAIQSGTSVNFTETTTTDFGSTSGFGLTVQVSGANLLLTGSATTSGWAVKSIVRSI